MDTEIPQTAIDYIHSLGRFSGKPGLHRIRALCAALAPGGQGLAYALAAGQNGDVRTLCRQLNARFGGRGGGKAGFCQGSLPADADRAAVEAFLRQGR